MDKQLSTTIKTMLAADRDNPIRKNTVNIIMMGRQLLKTKEVINSGGRREWTAFLKNTLGESNQTYSQKAMYLAKHIIPPDHIKTKSATELYKLCNKGIYPKYEHIQKAEDLTKTIALSEKVKVESPFERTYTGNSPNKDIVENYVVNLGERYLKDKVNCLTLTCDRYQMHVDRLFDRFAKKVYILERATDKMKYIQEQATTCPYNLSGKVSFIPLDADEFTLTNCRFVDLDISGSIATTVNAIRAHALRQHRRNSRINVFAFTFSSRGGPYENTETNFKNLQAIMDCFDIDLIGFDEMKGDFGKGVKMPGSVHEHARKADHNRYCMKHTVNYKMKNDNTEVYELVYFTYSDTSAPMGHMAIVYKY
jgi:hypothetical protein